MNTTDTFEYLVTDTLTGTASWVAASSPQAAVIGDRKGHRAGADYGRGATIIDVWCGDRVIRGPRSSVARHVIRPV